MAREIIDSATALTALCYAATNSDHDACEELKRSVITARGDARLQLYEGPSAREACDMGWEEAVNVLSAFWQNCGQDLWVHEDDPSDICTSQPEHDHVCDDECRSDGCWYNYDDQYRCVDAGVVGRVIFGDELFDYIK